MLKRENVRRSVNDSLSSLQTDYIDLYLVHWPRAANGPKGPRAPNSEYRRLVWDELSLLHKYVVRMSTELITLAVKITCFGLFAAFLLNNVMFVH